MGISYIITIMHNYPQNDIFLDYNLKLHKMIEMYLKDDNMHTSGIFNALICINNHLNLCTNCMLSITQQCNHIGYKALTSTSLVDRIFSEITF